MLFLKNRFSTKKSLLKLPPKPASFQDIPKTILKIECQIEIEILSILRYLQNSFQQVSLISLFIYKEK